MINSHHIQTTTSQPAYPWMHYYTPTHTTQSTNQLFLDVSRFSIEFDKSSCSYLAATVWNGLPLNIRLSPTLNTFKRCLKTHLVN